MLPAEEVKFLPKRCFFCHGVGHNVTDCGLTSICGRCSASDHSSTKVIGARKICSAFCAKSKVMHTTVQGVRLIS